MTALELLKIIGQKHHSELSKEQIGLICKFLNVKRNHVSEEYWQHQWYLIRKHKDKFYPQSYESFKLRQENEKNRLQYSSC